MAVEFHIEVNCTTCGKEVYQATATSEEKAKEDFAKAITLSETHDCKATPKK